MSAAIEGKPNLTNSRSRNMAHLRGNHYQTEDPSKLHQSFNLEHEKEFKRQNENVKYAAADADLARRKKRSQFLKNHPANTFIEKNRLSIDTI